MPLAEREAAPVPWEPRVRCAACERPASVCLCSELVPVRTDTRVVILQHPRESGVPIGTARLAELALSNSERHVGVDFSSSARLAEVLADRQAPAVLLYPGPEARDLAENPPEGPVTLVVIDGTWWQAKKLFKKNPLLWSLPRYALSPAVPSRYRIRREPALHCVSTIEAITQALTLLERERDVSALLKPFDAMVEHQLRFAGERRAKRHVVKARSARPRRWPAALAERAGDLVVGYAETNAWPRGTPLGSQSEVVHLVLERVLSGERFEAFIAPRRPLSPSFSHHTGLERELVLAGAPFSEFVERWQAFIKPDDVLGTWGHFWSQALALEGLALPEQIDLRLVARRALKERTGDVEECARKLGAPQQAAWAPGRTGRRAASATAVARALMLTAGGAEP
jgi:DTW domain-containing protein YfiP